MKKIDVTLSLIAGEGIALLFIYLIKNSASALSNSAIIWLLTILFPLLSLFCLWIAYLIGKKFVFIFQLAKFLLIGAVFAIFDLIIFNTLLKIFGITETGWKYLSFVGTSFIIATCAKYIADKYWAFEKKEGSDVRAEFVGFFIVTLISGAFQIGIASFVAGSNPLFGLNPLVWANVGKMCGILAASAWNFIGYKFFVFKK